MYDQPHNDFDEHEHGEDASSAAYDAERERDKGPGECFECGGKGYIVTCCDDLCANSDRCIHDGDGEEFCEVCQGEGVIPRGH